MKSRELIKMSRLNTGNVSSKGSQEIHTSFILTKHCMVPVGWRVKEEYFCQMNHDLEVSLKGF